MKSKINNKRAFKVKLQGFNNHNIGNIVWKIEKKLF